MKNFITYILCIILFAHFSFAQCPEREVVFRTQEQVDEFAVNYPDCEEIKDNIQIGPSTSIINLTALKNLKSVSGSIIFTGNDALVNLSGLENLSSIAALSFQSNPILNDISSLKNLNANIGALAIIENRALTNLTGLENLTSIKGNLELRDNYALTNILSLKNLTEIHGTLTLNNNDGITDFSAFENVDSLGGFTLAYQDNVTELPPLKKINSLFRGLQLKDNKKLKDLSGLENLRSTSFLEVEYNISLKSLADLKNLTSVHSVYIKYTKLRNLKGFENIVSIGGSFELSDNEALPNFKGLENLESIGGSFRISGNYSLKSLDGLENLTLIGRSLDISGKDLENINALANLTSIGGGLSIGGTELLTNIDVFENITSIGGNLDIGFNDNLLNINGLKNLTFIDWDLNISSNKKLESLASLKKLKFIGKEIKIDNNYNLNFCSIPFLCGHLVQNNAKDIEKNGEDCNGRHSILKRCESSFAKLKSIVFYDINQNKVQEEEEPLVSIRAVSINPDNINILHNSLDGFGVFDVYKDTPYTVNFNETLNKHWKLTTDTISHTINIKNKTCELVSFGVYPNQFISKMQSITNILNVNCFGTNDTIPLYLSTKNTGTTQTKGIVWLKVDKAIKATEFSNQPDFIESGNQFGWYFDNLFPGQFISEKINLVSPSLGFGNTFYFESFTEFSDENGLQNSETCFYNSDLRCSFAPNKIFVNPDRQCSNILHNEDIIFTIRFQNTSSDEVANTVAITNEMNSNLDLCTFSLIGSSHLDSLQTSITGNGTVIFEFSNINLPDPLSDLEGSQGYVSYSIRAKAGLPENTIIKNSSTIYFNYSSEVITNTVENLLVSEINETACNCEDNLLITWCRDADNDGLGDPNKSFNSCLQPEGYVADCSDLSDLVGIEEEQHSDLINIYPNPSNGNFKIDVGNSNFRKATFSLYNSNGQLIVEPIPLNGLELGLDYPELENGIYYVQIKLDDLVLRKKLMVVK